MFFCCLNHPFPLGSAIIPRRTHFGNHSFQIIFIMQPALLGTALPEWKGLQCLAIPDLYYMLLSMLVLDKMRWERMAVGEQRNSLGEQEGFSVPGSRTETICMINSLQVNFLIKWKQIPKQRYFCIVPPDRVPGCSPVQASLVPDNSPLTLRLGVFQIVLCFLSNCQRNKTLRTRWNS